MTCYTKEKSHEDGTITLECQTPVRPTEQILTLFLYLLVLLKVIYCLREDGIKIVHVVYRVRVEGCWGLELRDVVSGQAWKCTSFPYTFCTFSFSFIHPSLCICTVALDCTTFIIQQQVVDGV